jgi:hypothetical protein
MIARTRLVSVLALAASTALTIGCNDEGSTADPSGTGAGAGSGGSGGSGGGPGAQTAKFSVRIENVSGDATFSTAISPAAWALHGAANPLFDEGMADRGQGLEHIAEDGNPTDLDAALEEAEGVAAHGVVNTPVGADEPGAIFPGGAYEVEIEASSDAPNLSFASMFGNSNDVFFAPDGAGIALFDDEGMPIASQDVTSAVLLWDAGTEVNQAPNSGPLQAPRQGTPDTGPAEGRLEPFGDSTRALPSAWQVARVSVAKAGDGFDVTVANVSGPGGAVASGISPVFYALHNENWSLFQPNSPASAGIEAIAEDGNSAVLVAEEAVQPGVSLAAAATVPVGADGPGAAKPGEMYTFHVTPSATARYLSVATMFGQSNDAFLGFGPEGVELADEQGAPRSEADVNADLERKLVLWDAGTEDNQVPGAGGFTGPFQPAPNSGPVDATPGVRRYGDATNDLAGPGAGGVLEVKVTPGEGNDLLVTVTNTSDETAYPTKLSPLVFAVHDGVSDFFPAGAAAPAYVERLAEDGNPSDWGAALNGAGGVAEAGTVGDKPIEPGESWTFTVSVTPDARVLGLAMMVATSNDTFVSLGPKGVELADTQGDPRPLADINADLAAALGAWDAGTEANQAAALGPDQAPRQAGPNTGPAEGDGTVRAVDQVWAFPPVGDVIRVTVTLEE